MPRNKRVGTEGAKELRDRVARHLETLRHFKIQGPAAKPHVLYLRALLTEATAHVVSAPAAAASKD